MTGKGSEPELRTSLSVCLCVSGEKGSPGEIKTSPGDPGQKGEKGISGNPGPEGETGLFMSDRIFIQNYKIC